MAGTDDRLAEMEARLARVDSELATLRKRHVPPCVGASAGNQPVSRRGMLRRMGGVAAAGTVAAVGATVAGATAAGAADPNDVVKGTQNSSGDQTTQLTSTSTGATLHVYNTSGATTGIPNAIFAQTSDPANNADAIWSISKGLGAGVHGQSNTVNGIGVKAQGGRAQLLLQPQSGTGRPTTPNHARGEIYLDSVGALFVCVTGGSTTSGSTPAWVRVGFNPVTTFRVCDTRSGMGTPYSGTKLAAGATLSVALAGAAGTGVPPAGANAAVFNLTVTNGPAVGFLTAYPSGTARPLAASVNWGPNQTVGNYVTMQLGANGAVQVFNGSTAPVDVIVDITGYFS